MKYIAPRSAAVLLTDPCMAPLLKAGGLAAAVATFAQQHQAEAERLMRARLNVVKMLNGLDEFSGIWAPVPPDAKAEEAGEPALPTELGTAVESVVRAACALGQVSVLDAATIERALDRISALAPDHPLVAFSDDLQAACEPMDVGTPLASDRPADGE